MIKEITDQQEWDNFFLKIERRTFLNSWNWGEFRKKLGNQIWRKAVLEAEELNSLFLISKIQSKKGSFLLLTYCPAMPIFSKTVLVEAILEIKRIAKLEKVDFIRIVPFSEKESGEALFLKELGFRESPSFVFPLRGWEVDISGSEEEILSKMKKDFRYNVKKGLKEQKVEVLISNNRKDLPLFYNLYQETARRQGFTPFSFVYLEKEFDAFSSDNQVKLFFGFYNQKCLAAAFLIFWAGKAFCHHSASLKTAQRLFGPLLVRWAAIREAKKMSCQKFDLGAIAPFDNCQHRWAGFTSFKKGLGGREVNYIRTQDLPLSSKYLITYWVEKLKRGPC